MSTRIEEALSSLKSALLATDFPPTPVVHDAFKVIESYCEGLCPKCDGQKQVRFWYAQDELGPPETCRACKGTGRKK